MSERVKRVACVAQLPDTGAVEASAGGRLLCTGKAAERAGGDADRQSMDPKVCPGRAGFPIVAYQST